MAETKTTIPVEIKMGNAGAEGANLPAFKEGSIIFTKDTKKIYIDPVGETERIAVGGSAEDGVGQKTADGGEIFNDYENNQGLSDKSHAEGTETIAGSKAFIVQSYTAATTAYESYPTFTLDGIEGLAVDDIYSLSASGWKNAEEIGKIVEISGNTVKVTAVPSDIGNVDFTQITCYFRITAKPTVGSTAFGTAAHSEGYHTYSEALGSHAEGANTIAGGKYSHAEGSSTFAGYAAHAEGKNTKAVTEGSHAEGLGTGATGYGAHAEGSGSEAKALGSHAEGRQTKAIVDYSHSEGYLTQASGKAAHAEGYGTLSGDTTSLTATTDSATDNGLYTHAEGNGSIASGHAAHAEGRDTQATGFCDHAEGQSTVASGSRSHAEGQNTKASNKNSHAEGEGSTANGRAAHAEGLSTKANGTNSHAEGESNEVTGKNSHAEGYNNTVSGESSHAEGAGNTVTKYYGHAEGYSNTVSGNYSHAEGRGNTVTGERSHAENDYNNVSGNYSHAEGSSNKLSGDYSHVGGRANVNSKNYSFMQGYALKNETANYKSVLGKFNADNENNLFEIGNGYYVQDADDVRSNAFVVNKDGYAEVQSQGTTDNSVIIKKTLDTGLGKKQDKITKDTSLICKDITLSYNNTPAFTISIPDSVTMKIDRQGTPLDLKGVETLYARSGIGIGEGGTTFLNQSVLRLLNDGPSVNGTISIQSMQDALYLSGIDKNNTNFKPQLKGIANGTADNDAVNVSQLNAKPGKAYGSSEIFNDYENNVVWSEKYDGGLLVTDLTDTVVTLENVEGLAVGGTFNIYSLTHDYTSDNLTITAINTSTNKVTFSSEYAGPPLTVATLFVVNSTATKTTKLFYKYAHAEGYQTKAINNYSHAEGWGTVAGSNTGISSEGIAQTAVGMYNAANPFTFFMVGNGTADNARSNAFAVYTDGHAEVKVQGTTDNSVVIKSELDKKQDDLKITLDSSNHNIQLSSSYNTFLLNKGTLGSVSNIIFSPSGSQQINYCKYICNELAGQSGSTMITLGDGKVAFTNYAGNGTIRLTNVATPADNLDAVNKKYVDDIKAELLNAITHPYTYDETTKELTLIL